MASRTRIDKYKKKFGKSYRRAFRQEVRRKLKQKIIGFFQEREKYLKKYRKYAWVEIPTTEEIIKNGANWTSFPLIFDMTRMQERQEELFKLQEKRRLSMNEEDELNLIEQHIYSGL